jgi:hypothetical protein
MTTDPSRALLTRFVGRYGIVDASIMLGRHPISLERMRDGQDEIPQSVAVRLKEMERILG